MLAAALLAGADGDPLLVAAAGALLLDLVLHLLPWRVPRDERTVLGYWAETLAYLVPLGVVAAAWLRPPSLALLAAWLVPALAVAMALIALSGIDLRLLRTGDLAFLAGPLPRHRAAARILSAATAPLLEEVIFRGIPADARWTVAVVMLGGAAFVCRHHLVRGSEERLRWPVVRSELAAAALLAVLVLASGSVWPAILAHLLANLPKVVLDAQRASSNAHSYVHSEVIE